MTLLACTGVLEVAAALLVRVSWPNPLMTALGVILALALGLWESSTSCSRYGSSCGAAFRARAGLSCEGLASLLARFEIVDQ